MGSGQLEERSRDRLGSSGAGWDCPSMGSRLLEERSRDRLGSAQTGWRLCNRTGQSFPKRQMCCSTIPPLPSRRGAGTSSSRRQAAEVAQFRFFRTTLQQPANVELLKAVPNMCVSIRQRLLKKYPLFAAGFVGALQLG
eukprot:6110718-Amphidinium_carterae.1